MAGGELRLGTTSMYMTTCITRFRTNQHINTNLHGYILGGKCKLIAQNQALARVNRGKFSLAVRVNDVTLGPLESIYNGIMIASAKQQLEYIPGDKLSLWYFFKTAEFWKEDVLLTPVLIRDQFEELFTLHSEGQRGAFIDQLSNLVRGVPPSKQPSEIVNRDGCNALITKRPPQLKILISLREEFLPYLEEFSDRIPEIFDQRFRLQPLRRDAASRALD